MIPSNEGKYMAIYRHGDILIRSVDSVPADATEVPADKRGLVLAEGEVTGHHHRVNDVTAGKLVTKGQAESMRMWLTLDAPADLTHEEHHTITLPAGDYEVIRQVEYEPEGLRNVAD